MSNQLKKILGFLRHVLGRPEIPLFLLLLGAYGYFYQAGGSNQNSRLDLVRSIVEQGTFQIDAYHHNTIDKSQWNQHYYSDKAPGVSWLAVPAYWVMRFFSGGNLPGVNELHIDLYAMTIWSVALPSAVSAVMLYLFLDIFGTSSRARVAFALAYGLGTLSFPYSTLFYGHQLAAALLLSAFALLARMRHARIAITPGMLGIAGVLLGYAVATEYPAAIASAIMFVYAMFFVRPLPRLGWLAAGAALPGCALAVYHTMAFGGPLTLPYTYSTQVHRHLGFFMGIQSFNVHALLDILLTHYRGLFYSAPWLLLAIPGIALLIREPRFRAEGLVSLAIILLFIWLNASLVDWQGGWAMGPRYLIPAIPFFAVATVCAWRFTLEIEHAAWPDGMRRILVALQIRNALKGIFKAAFVISVFRMLVGTAVTPQVPTDFLLPFEQALYPSFFSGNLAINPHPLDKLDSDLGTKYLHPLAWNVGQLLGLDGLFSLLPLMLYLTVMGVWLLWACSLPQGEKVRA